MTIKVNHLTGSTYYPADDQNQWAAAEPNGTKAGLAVTAHSPNNLSVDVALGTAFYNGLFMNSDSTQNVLIGSNASGYGRIDSIVADMDNSIITAVQGTPSASPTPPVLTGNKLLLANVTVGNNVSSIVPGNIADMRTDVPILTDCNGLSANAASGFYVCIAGTTANVPAASANGGILIHAARIGRISQLYIDSTTNIMYLRSFNGTTWSAWEAVGTNVYKDTWHDFTLQNSWTNVGGSFSNAGYILTPDNHVELRGNVKTGATGTVAFTLPAGYRPTTEQLIPLLSNGSASPASIDIIASTGVCYINFVTNNTNIALSGVRFPLF